MATYEITTKFGVGLRVEHLDLSKNFENIFSLDKSENLVISQKELFVTRTLEESRAKSESSRVNVVGTHFFYWNLYFWK
jgi:hypothetical protein